MSMKLYAFSFDGIMLYARGNLSCKQIEDTNIFLKSYTIKNNVTTKNELFSTLIKELNQHINTNLEITDIEYVFNYDVL